MNGRAITLGIVGALALAGARRAAGSRADRWTTENAESPTLGSADRTSRQQAVRLLQTGCEGGIYHVTRTPLLRSIRRRGLVPTPENVTPNFADFAKSGHLTSKVFLAVGVDSALKWWDAVQWWGEAELNGVSLLRIRPDRIAKWRPKLEVDREGGSTHRCSFAVILEGVDDANNRWMRQKNIPPEDLEIARLMTGVRRRSLPKGNNDNQEPESPIYQALKSGYGQMITWTPIVTGAQVPRYDDVWGST